MSDLQTKITYNTQALATFVFLKNDFFCNFYFLPKLNLSSISFTCKDSVLNMHESVNFRHIRYKKHHRYIHHGLQRYTLLWLCISYLTLLCTIKHKPVEKQ